MINDIVRDALLIEKKYHQVWVKLTDKLKIDQESSGKVWINILHNYGEPDRYYHNMNHIVFCFERLEEYRIDNINAIHDYNAIEFALWFHDIVYNTKNIDNEEQSADFAKNSLQIMNVTDRELINSIVNTILVTKHQKSDLKIISLDEKLVLDVDLSILGSSPKTFTEYDKNIRSEYDWVSDNVFFSHRRKIMNNFLERNSIYNTDYFRNKYEKQARKNIKNLLDNLSKEII